MEDKDLSHGSQSTRNGIGLANAGVFCPGFTSTRGAITLGSFDQGHSTKRTKPNPYARLPKELPACRAGPIKISEDADDHQNHDPGRENPWSWKRTNSETKDSENDQKERDRDEPKSRNLALLPLKIDADFSLRLSGVRVHHNVSANVRSVAQATGSATPKQG